MSSQLLEEFKELVLILKFGHLVAIVISWHFSLFKKENHQIEQGYQVVPAACFLEFQLIEAAKNEVTLEEVFLGLFNMLLSITDVFYETGSKPKINQIYP